MVAHDLEAWNILVIYLEQRNAALSDKRAGQGPTSAVGQDTSTTPAGSAAALAQKELAKHMLGLFHT